jgi:ribosomal protein S18 acetylase RimI-like enzyme
VTEGVCASPTAGDGIALRPLGTSDLDAVAATHRAAFPDSALTRLGREAVRRYYEWQLLGPHDAAVFGAFQGSTLVGFCFGGTFRGATTGFIRRHRIYLASLVLTRPWLVANPLFRDRLKDGLAILSRSPDLARIGARTPKADPPPRQSFGILAIAVHPQWQRYGIGKLLMREAEQAARARQLTQMHLTVHPDNAAAVSFYEARDWTRVSHRGHWRGRMIKRLAPA